MCRYKNEFLLHTQVFLLHLSSNNNFQITVEPKVKIFYGADAREELSKTLTEQGVLLMYLHCQNIRII